MKNLMMTLIMVVTLGLAAKGAIGIWNGEFERRVVKTCEENLNSDTEFEDYLVDKYCDIDYDYERNMFGIITDVTVTVKCPFMDDVVETGSWQDVMINYNE